MAECSTSNASRSALAILFLFLVLGTFAAAGPRASFLMLTGLGFGLVLEGFRFGFTGPWRRIVVEKDGRGLLAQFAALALCAALSFPLLSAFPGELTGAHAPVGVAMVAAAFVFGIAMQVVLGCGSGVLVNAGSGNLAAMVALLGFVGGSFFGSLHLSWWVSLGALPVYSLQDFFGSGGGLAVTLAGLAGLAAVVVLRSAAGKRKPSPQLWLAAALIAGLAVLNLVIAGQPWGVVYGLGLWGAKLAQGVGVDVASMAFWSEPAHSLRLQQHLLTDFTSVTNIGIIAGAFIAMRWRQQVDAQAAPLAPAGWAAVLVSGLVLGYSARVAFGCNIGAYFSGIATGSLHGWVWFAAAFAGSAYGIRLRPKLLRPAVLPAAPASAPRSGPAGSAAENKEALGA